MTRTTAAILAHIEGRKPRSNGTPVDLLASDGRVRVTLPYPPSLNRMYRAVNGRSILSRAGRDYKARTAGMLAGARPILDGDVRVTLGVYRPARRGDLDNTLKATLDALAGVAYRNDAQIVSIDAERFEDKRNPRIEVLVERARAARGVPVNARQRDN